MQEVAAPHLGECCYCKIRLCYMSIYNYHVYYALHDKLQVAEIILV